MQGPVSFSYCLAEHNWNSALSGSEKTELRLILSTYSFTNESQQAGKISITPDDVVVQLKLKSTAFRAKSETKTLCFDCWGFQASWPVFRCMLNNPKFQETVRAAKHISAASADQGEVSESVPSLEEGEEEVIEDEPPPETTVNSGSPLKKKQRK